MKHLCFKFVIYYLFPSCTAPAYSFSDKDVFFSYHIILETHRKYTSSSTAYDKVNVQASMEEASHKATHSLDLSVSCRRKRRSI